MLYCKLIGQKLCKVKARLTSAIVLMIYHMVTELHLFRSKLDMHDMFANTNDDRALYTLLYN